MPDIYLDVDVAVAVPVNLIPLLDDSDFKTREAAIAYNQAGMDLVWNFVTSAGVMSQTAVTPTTGGDYDWTHVGDGMYKIEIPASGGGSINNDTEGYGWFTGVCTGVLPWRSPIFGFRAAGLNDLLCDSAYSATRGLAGTALPVAVADAAGGLVISDAGGLDIDAIKAKTDTLGTDDVTVTSPVASDGAVAFTPWDSLYNSQSRSLEWTNSDGDWGSSGTLTGSTIQLKVTHKHTGTSYSYTGSVVTSSGTQKVRIELGSTQTGVFTEGRLYDYHLRALGPGSTHRETLQIGTFTPTASLFASSS